MTTIEKSNLLITARNEVAARYCPGRGVSVQGGLSPSEVSIQEVGCGSLSRGFLSRGWGFYAQGGGGCGGGGGGDLCPGESL